MAHHAARTNPHLPVPPIRRVLRPLAQFLRIESASGVVLLVCTAIALAFANSPVEQGYHDFWHTHVGLTVGGVTLGGELGHFFVNDVLMTIFFFVVGLEIKREIVAGELRDPRTAALPVVAALGGMVVPAAVYAVLLSSHPGSPAARGWGVPMATDIAFVVGVMAVLGPRVPLGLKVMLLSLAIADDIGAVIVIAVFYSANLSWAALGLAGLGFALVLLVNRLGVRSIPVYFVLGTGVWLAFFQSGVHPTMTGVILGLMTPAREWVERDALRLSLTDLAARLEHDGTADPGELAAMSFAARESVSPLERLEAGLHPWVGFVVMPLFALANAGVHVEVGELTSPVAVGVALGLFLGKPLGIAAFSWLAIRLGVARLPTGVSWWALLGGGFLAGIGFTMSLFVAGLAFAEHPGLLTSAKVGTLAGSLLSVVLGTGILLAVLRKPPAVRSGEPRP